ncbi:MAG: aldehyde dehydrogenase family protein, partial [Cyanobacteria bacterium]|nr:aldehyde dehydrogenase family protein [Cyanobacteriota bacterium]
EWTPNTATLLAQLCQEAGLPPGVFNIVHGFGAGEAGEALTTHEGVSAISFTGETGTGKAIMAASAPTLKKISFELGGKGANILFPDANLDIAIPTALRSAFRNQGQICLAGSRLFVHTSILEEVIEKMSEGVKAIRVGDPMDPNTQMGALISKEHFLKVKDYAEKGAVEGQWICGGKAPTPEIFQAKDFKPFSQGNFITPGLYTAKPGQTHYANTSFCQEEIFGPLLPIIPFENESQVIEQFNSTPYGLSCSIWSQDVNRCHRVSQKIKTGIVWVNCWFARDLRTPFGGQKASGIGREGGRYSLEFFSEAKTICYRYEPESV